MKSPTNDSDDTYYFHQAIHLTDKKQKIKRNETLD